jgi:hypothetical protein
MTNYPVSALALRTNTSMDQVCRSLASMFRLKMAKTLPIRMELLTDKERRLSMHILPKKYRCIVDESF